MRSRRAQRRAAEDAALVSRVRHGDERAFADLYARHHPMARRVARSVAHPNDVEDVVSEAFMRTLTALRAGSGPTESFTGYLATTVHRTWLDRLRRMRDIAVDVDDLEDALAEDDESEHVAKAEAFRDAFAELTPRWQQVLWLTEVEQLPHARIAAIMDIQPNAVAALAYRARKALQDAYLRQHVATTEVPACTAIRELLPEYVNGRLSALKTQQVQAHVATCVACHTCLEDLRDARANLGVWLLPIAATTGAPAALTGGLGAAGTTSTAGWTGAVTSQLSTVVAGAVAVATAGAVMALGPVDSEPPEIGTARFEAADLRVDRAPQPTVARRVTAAPEARSRSVAPPRRRSAAVQAEPSVEPEQPASETVATARPTPTPSPDPAPSLAPTPTTPDPTPTPTTAPTPTPTTAPSPEPTPTPEPPAHPRIVAVTESPSPWGPHWRRITLSLADVGEGTALTLTAHGRFGYCGPRCDPHPRRVHRLLVRWADVVGRETITMDFHPDSDVALRFELLPPDGTEAGDTVATHVIRAETD